MAPLSLMSKERGRTEIIWKMRLREVKSPAQRPEWGNDRADPACIRQSDVNAFSTSFLGQPRLQAQVSEGA